ncbi:MAG: TonB-dependent receptor [Alphaproteobacteria bacterium]|nr:TonB-dependent receptor [Alphaproteobacteria bacterium]
MTSFRFLAVLLFLVSMVAPGLAQTRVPDTVVTATRLETPTEEVGSSITVITASDMEARQQRTVVDVLSAVPGFRVVQSGGPGRQTSIFARGTNSNHTIVLIDGIEIGDASSPNGAFNYAHLTTSAIDRIEIVRGPQGTLFGSEAIGGVINIITKQGSAGLRPTASVEGGSFSTVVGSGAMGGAIGKLTYFGSLSRYSSQGQSITPPRFRSLAAGASDEADGYENGNGVFKVNFPLSDRSDVRLVGHHLRTAVDTDQPIEDRNATERTRQWFGRAEVRTRFLAGDVETTVGTAFTRHHRDTKNLPDIANTRQVSNNLGLRHKIDVKNDYFGIDDHVLSLGLETEQEKLIDRQASNFSGFIVRGTSDAEVRTNALFVQDHWTIRDNFTVTFGGRLDDHDAFGRAFTYRATPVYRLTSTATKFRGTYGTGFRAPALFQLFGFTANSIGGTFRGNPNLVPERAKGWELGAEQPLLGGVLTVGSVYFHSDVRNLIDTVFVFPNSQVRNLNDAEMEGFESFVAWRATPAVDVRLDHTFTRAENATTGGDLLRRPRHKLDGDVRYRVDESLTLSATGQFIGQTKDITGNPNASAVEFYKGSYLLFGVAATLAVRDDVRLFVRADNVLNREYETADGLRGYGRGVFAGIGATF